MSAIHAWPRHSPAGTGPARRAALKAIAESSRSCLAGRARRSAPGSAAPGRAAHARAAALRSGRRRGWCWPRARSPRPPAERRNAAPARTTSRATRRSRSTWCWLGGCSPQDRPGQASALLARLHAAAVSQGRTGITEIGAVQALALAAAGGENAAVDVLAQGLILGCPQGYVRVVTLDTAKKPISHLLGKLGTRPPHRGRNPGPANSASSPNPAPAADPGRHRRAPVAGRRHRGAPGPAAEDSTGMRTFG
jgi:hypothetical protein